MSVWSKKPSRTVPCNTSCTWLKTVWSPLSFSAKGRYSNAVTPDLILLDLNLPKRDGREVLEDIKADQELRAIPVIVLTTSDDEHDVLRAYGLHANCYLTKPVDLDDFLEKIRSVENFWIKLVRLPRFREHA